MSVEVLNLRNAALVSTDTIGERIKKARIARGITQTELARKIGTIYQRVHEWEEGWKSPSEQYIGKIAAFLEVDVEWLRSGSFSNEPLCVYKQFYCAEHDNMTEEQFRKQKDSLARITDYLVKVDSKTLGDILTILEKQNRKVYE